MQAEETPYWCGHDAHVPGDCPWAAEETPGLSEARVAWSNESGKYWKYTAPYQGQREAERAVFVANEVEAAIAEAARRPLLDALRERDTLFAEVQDFLIELNEQYGRIESINFDPGLASACGEFAYRIRTMFENTKPVRALGEDSNG